MLQGMIHYGLHFIAPILIALIFYRTTWKKTYLLFLSTMLVDADHLLSTPIFDPNRCSIGFHFLHTYYAIGIYALVYLFARNSSLKILALGLLFHMFTDSVDCYMSHNW